MNLKQIMALVIFFFSLSISQCNAATFKELISMIKNNDIETVEKILKENSNLSQKIVNPDTIFNLVINSDSIKMAELFIDYGVNIHLTKYPFAWVKSLEMGEFLISKGIDINKKDEHGKTALFRMNDSEIFNMLINNGANINITENSGSTPLLTALSRGKLDWAITLIEKGADISAVSNNGYNALFATVQARKTNHEILDTLIKNGLDINSRDNKGKTAIMHTRDATTLGTLIERGADINLKDYEGKNALINLIKNPLKASTRKTDSNKLSGLIKLLVKAHIDINSTDNNGNTALFYFSEYTLDSLDILTSNGADINIKNIHGDSALLHHIKKDHNKVVRSLVNSGADLNAHSPQGKKALLYLSLNNIVRDEYLEKNTINTLDNNGWTPLMYAIFSNKEQLEKAIKTPLSRKGVTVSRLEPSASDTKSKIEQLILLGADLDIKTIEGRTALSWTIESNFTNIAEILINKGASPFIEDNNGTTPLMYALNSKNSAIKSLTNNFPIKAKINSKDNKGMTALMQISLLENSNELIKKYINNGADITLTNNRGQDTLTLASYHCNPEITKLFIEQGANVNNISQFGESAIINTAYAGCTASMKLLLEAGANTETKNSRGETPLIIASGWGHTETVKALIEAGANINVETTEGMTALESAFNYGNFKIGKVLLKKGAKRKNLKDLSGNAMVNAVLSNDEEAIQLLLDAKVNLNKLNAEGFSPLHMAIIIGDIKTAGLLINNGADVNKTSTTYVYSGYTGQMGQGVKPIIASIRNKQPDIISLLMRNGANAPENILIEGVNTNNPSVINELIKNGVDIDKKNKRGNTALHYAVSFPGTECMEGACSGPIIHIDSLLMTKTLIDNGADVNAKNNYGSTPLHSVFSSIGGEVQLPLELMKKLVMLLLENNADKNIKDNEGKPPLGVVKKFIDENKFTFLQGFANELEVILGKNTSRDQQTH